MTNETKLNIQDKEEVAREIEKWRGKWVGNRGNNNTFELKYEQFIKGMHKEDNNYYIIKCYALLNKEEWK